MRCTQRGPERGWFICAKHVERGNAPFDRNVYVNAVLAFIDVAQHVILVAWVALGMLIAALFAAAVNRFVAAAETARDILPETIAGLERSEALRLYAHFKTRSKSVGAAWLLSVVFGPLGAYAYLGDWGKSALALITLNGLGAWWIESWFSVPQIVILRERDLAAQSLAQLSFMRAQAAISERARR